AVTVDADAEQAARGRRAFQDVAVEVERRQLANAVLGVAPHSRGEIFPRALSHEARRLRPPDEADRLARDAEAELDLGAHRHPLHVVRERPGEEQVALVPAVVPHGLAEQARRDAEANLVGMRDRHGGHPRRTRNARAASSWFATGAGWSKRRRDSGCAPHGWVKR